jgi:Superinfection immunity protein
MTLVLFAIVMYFLPSIIAHNKRDFAGIFLLNFFLGWTVIGWIVAFIWACAASSVHSPVMIVAGPAGGHFCCQCGAMAHPAARFCGVCGRPV